jgi:Cu-Zn family superoxide dismutase
MKHLPIVLVTALSLAACASTTADPSASAPPGATAALANASGERRGTANVTDAGGSLQINVATEGMTPGTYAAHVHTTGKCDAPDFMTAGGHWNPATRQHGRDNPMGAHKGDLPNIEVGADGRGSVSFTIPDATLSELLDADGAAVVIHSAADDYRTDPTGNAGGRQACGVLARS